MKHLSFALVFALILSFALPATGSADGLIAGFNAPSTGVTETGFLQLFPDPDVGQLDPGAEVITETPDDSKDKPKEKEKKKQKPKPKKKTNPLGKKNTNVAKGAKKSVGKPQTGDYYDCSKFAQTMYKKYLNIELPRVTDTQLYHKLYTKEEAKKLKKGALYSVRVSKDQLKPGDLIFFKTGAGCSACTIDKSIEHVGIYVGNGKFVDSGNSTGKVAERNLDKYLSDPDITFKGAKRYYKKT